MQQEYISIEDEVSSILTSELQTDVKDIVSYLFLKLR